MACSSALRPGSVAAALASAALFFAFGAWAQTTTSSITVSPAKFGLQDCNDRKQIAVTWTFASTPTSSTVGAILSTDSACGAGTGTPQALSPPQGQSGTLTLEPGAFLYNVKANGCVADVKSSQPATIYVCVRYPATGTATEQLIKPVTFALTPPTAPASLSARAGDTHVKLSWAQGDATEVVSTYDVFARPASDLPAAADAGPADGGTSGETAFEGVSPIQTGVASTTFDVTAIASAALQNDVTYAFAVRGIDSFGNTSLVSDVFFGTPKAIDDFYNHYRGSGGENQGGCATLGNAGWIVALLGLALLFWRKRPGAALLLAATLGAGAQAQEDRFLKSDERPPRRLLFALKIDRYDPQIDTEAGLVAQAARPYHDVFHGRAPLRWQLEVDWQVAHPFGALLLGGTVGYWQNIGKGLNHETGLPSDDTALLDVVPLGLIATYRFDWPADRFHLPIIPYAQLGLQKAYWASFNGRGDVSRFRSAPADSGDRGSGWTTGWTSALGFALALDWLDPALAREAFNDIHLQRTSLFAEYGWTNLTGFGKSKAFILSDRAWRFGLALEF